MFSYTIIKQRKVERSVVINGRFEQNAIDPSRTILYTNLDVGEDIYMALRKCSYQCFLKQNITYIFLRICTDIEEDLLIAVLSPRCLQRGNHTS